MQIFQKTSKMNYREKARKASEEAHKKQVAVKLLDGIDKVVLEATNLSARRWVWELMQNAKDVANEKVKIEIELANNFVEFRHNGNPFEMEHLTYLIEQISTKERRNEEDKNEKKTTGQFGTGFMTTHLLSKIVDLEGILFDKDTKVYKNFNLRLDRSATTIEGMKKNVDLAFEVFYRLDNETESQEIKNYEKNKNCDTKFRYLLDEKSLEIAKKGIEDLYCSLPFTLVFLPQIEEVKIFENNEIKTFKNVEPISSENINISEIKINKKTFYIAHISNDSVTIALQLNKKNDKYFIEKPNENVPTLFCDFPLIGSENFTFPVIINSRYFYPTEPRDGIYLSDKDDIKIIENKNLIEQAKDLYFEILEHATKNWNDILWLAKTHIPENIDKEWFKENIQKPMREVLLKTAVVENPFDKFIPIQKNELFKSFAYFPFSDKIEKREKIWDFANDLFSFQLPKKEHIHIWHNILWDVGLKATIENLTYQVSYTKTSKKNIVDLKNQLKKGVSEINWLNNFIKFIEENEPELLDKYAILPNQYGDFKLKKELNIDKNIPKELKEALKILGDDWYSNLLDIEIKNAKIDKTWSVYSIIPAINAIIDRNEFFRFTVLTKQKLIKNNIIIPDSISEINNILYNRKDDFIKKIKNVFGTNFNSNIEKLIVENAKDKRIRIAIYLIISLFPEKENLKYRKDLYDLSKKFDNEIPIQNYNYKDLPISTWTKADNWLLKNIIEKIEKIQTLEKLKEHLIEHNESEFTEKDTLKWLNDFFKFIIENNKIDLLTENSIIYPNQNGEFCKKMDLFQDLNIPEEFKIILEDFEKIEKPENEYFGWKPQLLNIEIDAFNETENNFKPKTVKDISDRINEIIRENKSYENESFRNIIFKLLSLSKIEIEEKHESAWRFARVYYYENVPSNILKLENSLYFDWTECIKYFFTKLVIDIEQTTKIRNIKIYGNITLIEWLSNLIDFIKRDSELENLLDDYKIIPNQNGNLCYISDLFEEEGLEVELKKIVDLLNNNWIEKLTDAKIKLNLPEDKIKKAKDIYTEIDRIFYDYYISKSEQNLDYIKAWNDLTFWFNKKNIDLKEDKFEIFLQENFPKIYSKRPEIELLMLGSEEQKNNIRKIISSGKAEVLSQIANNFDQVILDEINKDPDRIKRLLTEDREKKTGKKTYTETNILDLFSEKTNEKFNSIDEIVNKLQDNVRKDQEYKFKKAGHTDWNAIREANEEANKKLEEFLRKNTDYNFNKWSIITKTIWQIEKNGTPIKIVIKSAKGKVINFGVKEENGEMIYPELEILSNTFSELWIYNGIGDPIQITLGKIIIEDNTKTLKVDMFTFKNRK